MTINHFKITALEGQPDRKTENKTHNSKVGERNLKNAVLEGENNTVIWYYYKYYQVILPSQINIIYIKEIC